MNSILKRKNLSETPFRLSVLQIIQSSVAAVSVSYIEDKLVKYNRVTLYRTIKTFLEQGIIHSIAIAGEELRYALCEHECEQHNHVHNHLHFQCNECDSVFCVNIPPNSFVNESVHEIHSYEIHAKGTCGGCKTSGN